MRIHVYKWYTLLVVYTMPIMPLSLLYAWNFIWKFQVLFYIFEIVMADGFVFFFFSSIPSSSNLYLFLFYQYKFKRFGFLLLAIYFRVLTAMFWIRTRVCTNFYLYAWTKIVSSLNFISRKNIIIQLGSKTLAGHLWYSSVGFCRFVNFFFLCKVLSTELVFSPVRSNKSE